jgi:malic enzyme
MRWSIETDPITGDEYVAVDDRGQALLLDPFTNKGTAFPASEREQLGLDGLLPAATCTIERQLDRVYENFRSKPTNLERYIHLASLQDRNETLFYRLLHDHLVEMLPVVYTPVVGEACQRFSHIYRRSRGLYLSYEQGDKIEQILASLPRPPAVIVVTDGERILGLGDQGIGGMGIPIGKLSLYTACAGIPPALTLPITLDVGTDNEERLEDPLYLGARHHRIRGPEYQAFIDRFVEAVTRVFPHTVLQWEDFLKANAIAQLTRFRDRLCTFNDDVQGTAAVAVAGLYSALRVTGTRLSDQRIMLAGAGASAQGIADLLALALEDAGLSVAEARRRIAMVDSQGLVTRDRPHLEEYKARYARTAEDLAGCSCRDSSRITLEEAARHFRPTILIGTSGQPQLFSEPLVRAMAALNRRPVIMPLSNPTSKSECTAEEAIRWSEGRAIVATGSPFDPVDFAGRRFCIGQGNNAFIFPGVGLGLWVGKVQRVTDAMFLDAAKALAREVTSQELERGLIYPDLSRIRTCSHSVACAIVRRAFAQGHARATFTRDVESEVLQAMWVPRYLPMRYEPQPEVSSHKAQVSAENVATFSIAEP